MPAEQEYSLRVCVTGAECTGKTALAHALGRAMGAPVVGEAVRDYFAEKLHRGDASVSADDIVRVADIQIGIETEAPKGEPLVIFDTDVLTIAIWHERFIGRRLAEIDELVRERFSGPDAMDLYILTAPDIPFCSDGLRGSEQNREKMHQVFLRSLAAAGRRFITVSGSIEERCETARAEIEAMKRQHARALDGHAH